MKKFFTLIAVAVMAFAANADVLTVCDAGADGYQAAVVPIYGLWADTEGTMGQMIYPADMLAEMVGSDISEMKFFTTAYWYTNFDTSGNTIPNSAYINFSGATIQLSLMTVDGTNIETAIVGATAVATTSPQRGDDHMTFVLDEPFHYEGGNLLVECKVIAAGSYGTTYFFGDATADDAKSSYYGYESYNGWIEYNVNFLPMLAFTYNNAGGDEPDPEPTGMCLAPNSGYVISGEETATVTIINREEGATVYFEVYCNDELVMSDSFVGDAYSFDVTGAGDYVVHAYAHLDGKNDSADGGVFFTIYEGEGQVGINELAAGKTIAGVRYFNMAGQEMQQANGMTIVVTTYTDGTTSTAKVMK